MPRVNLFHALSVALFVCSPSSAVFQAAAASKWQLTELLEAVEAMDSETLEDQVAICEVPAPPFHETERGLDYAQRFRDLGIPDVRIDSVGNVIAAIAASREEPRPRVILSAHLDTVFPPGTDVSVTRDATLLKGPGIIDDCRGLAVVLAVAKIWRQFQIQPRGTLLFVGTVGEEGAGNLRGVRQLFADHEAAGTTIDAFLSVDGLGASISHVAVGSNRYRVAFKGPGGHSYRSFGMPNPMHAVGRAIAKISDFEAPAGDSAGAADEGKVTFSVGLLDGGTSINSIAPEASFSIDMRSSDTTALAEIDSQFRIAVEEAYQEELERWRGDGATDAEEPQLTYEIETIGIRPAGRTPEHSLLVQRAQRLARAVGMTPELRAGSTDSNLPMSLGVPAITVGGGGSGSGAHSPATEVFETEGSYLGIQWILLLTLDLLGQLDEGEVSVLEGR